MPTYVMLANWTEQGMRSIGESPKRVDTAKKTLEEMGGQFRSVYMTMGDYDLIMIYDAPDDAVAARFTLMLGKLGNVRTTSLKAFPEEAFRQIVNRYAESQRLQCVPPHRQRQEREDAADADHQGDEGWIEAILGCHDGAADLRAHRGLEQRDLCNRPGHREQLQVEHRQQQRRDQKLYAEAASHHRASAAQDAEPELQTDGYQCQWRECSAKAREDFVDDGRIGNRSEDQREHQRNEWWERSDPPCNLADRCAAARAEAGDCDAQRAEHQIGAELIDQQADCHIVRPIK